MKDEDVLDFLSRLNLEELQYYKGAVEGLIKDRINKEKDGYSLNTENDILSPTKVGSFQRR